MGGAGTTGIEFMPNIKTIKSQGIFEFIPNIKIFKSHGGDQNMGGAGLVGITLNIQTIKSQIVFFRETVFIP